MMEEEGEEEREGREEREGEREEYWHWRDFTFNSLLSLPLLLSIYLSFCPSMYLSDCLSIFNTYLLLPSQIKPFSVDLLRLSLFYASVLLTLYFRQRLRHSFIYESASAPPRFFSSFMFSRAVPFWQTN